MRNEDGQKMGGGGGKGNGLIPSSFRAISSYLRIVSSGASTVASTVRSAASSIVDRDDNDARNDQVLWAGFDKIEFEEDVRRVLLLGYRSGFQVWDVEEAHDVHELASRHDGPVSLLQVLPKPLSTMTSCHKFSDSRPLVVVCTAGSPLQDGVNAFCNGGIPNYHDAGNGNYGPSAVRFYSLSCQSYVHELKFRSAVYSVRCSSRVVAVSQAAQVHCFNAATLEREYTVLTNPVMTGGLGCGALALGPRWLAYSGSPVEVPNASRVSLQHLTPSASFPTASNGGRVAQYAKESSKHLASGIATLRDMGYKKLSRYYSDVRSDSNHLVQSGMIGGKASGGVNGPLADMDTVGMVIVKDVVTKAVITQFRAHKSPISALCFDPSGTLLVTASVQGHNINVFLVSPGVCGISSVSDAEASGSSVHLYRLQRGLTNAIIQDIAFSSDSRWIMISSSRGTNHLFAISPFGGPVDLHCADTYFSGDVSCLSSNSVLQWQSKPATVMFNNQRLFAPGPPVTLSVVSRIRNGTNGWRGTVNGAAAVATGKNSSLCGAIAAAFHLCSVNNLHATPFNFKSNYHLLVFSPSGSLIQYSLRASHESDPASTIAGVGPFEAGSVSDPRFIVEATQKWTICQKWRDQEDDCDIYGENGFADSNKVFHGVTRNGPGSKYVKTRSKATFEEKNLYFISEAELQTHERQVPLWLRSQIYFHSVESDGMKALDHAGGEFEIEKIPTHVIEARTKTLVPFFDYSNSPKSVLSRMVPSDSKFETQLPPQLSDLSQNGNFLSSGSPFSYGLRTESGAQLHSANGVTMDGLLKPAGATIGCVNTSMNESPAKVSEVQVVNSSDREPFEIDPQHKFVNNCCETLKVENQFEDEDEDEDEEFH